MDRPPRNNPKSGHLAAGAVVLAALWCGGPVSAAEPLAGSYEAEILSVSAGGTLHAAVRTWFGQVTLARVTPRSIKAVTAERECGTFNAGGRQAVAPGKWVLLSDVRSGGSASGYVADVRYLVAAKGARGGPAGVPTVLKGGKSASCRPR